MQLKRITCAVMSEEMGLLSQENSKELRKIQQQHSEAIKEGDNALAAVRKASEALKRCNRRPKVSPKSGELDSLIVTTKGIIQPTNQQLDEALSSFSKSLKAVHCRLFHLRNSAESQSQREVALLKAKLQNATE